MATVNDIYAFLNDLAPVRYQMDFDNAGFLVGDGSAAVEHVLLALDITDDVIAEATALRAQLIVSHHPLIFTPLRHATTDDLTGRKVLALARNGIAAVCMHTNLDIADGGVNDALMVALGAEVTGGLEPSGTDDDGSALTCGRVGRLPESMALSDFLPYVADRLHANGLRYVDGGRPVQKLAVCGGSGGIFSSTGSYSFVRLMRRGRQNGHFFNLRRHCRPHRREYLHRRCRPGTHREVDLYQTVHGDACAAEHHR